MGRATTVAIVLAGVGALAGIASSVSTAQTVHWGKAAPIWLGLVAWCAVGGVAIAHPPKHRLSRRAAIRPTTAMVGESLGAQVVAAQVVELTARPRGGLQGLEARIVGYAGGPPDYPRMPLPIRLKWLAGAETRTGLHQGATSAFVVVSDPIGVVVTSPDVPGPGNWSLPPSEWTFDIQLVADGHVAERMTAVIGVEKDEGPFTTSRWVKLVVGTTEMTPATGT